MLHSRSSPLCKPEDTLFQRILASSDSSPVSHRTHQGSSSFSKDIDCSLQRKSRRDRAFDLHFGKYLYKHDIHRTSRIGPDSDSEGRLRRQERHRWATDLLLRILPLIRNIALERLYQKLNLAIRKP